MKEIVHINEGAWRALQISPRLAEDRGLVNGRGRPAHPHWPCRQLAQLNSPRVYVGIRAGAIAVCLLQRPGSGGFLNGARLAGHGEFGKAHA